MSILVEIGCICSKSTPSTSWTLRSHTHTETLKIHVNDVHCLQIIFGCSHNNSYARVLEKYMYEKEALTKITLLEGVPFEKELETLIQTSHFQQCKFGNLFQETKISLAYNSLPAWAALNEQALRAVNAGTPSRHLSRTPSDSVSSSTAAGATGKPPAFSWAAKAAAPPPGEHLTSPPANKVMPGILSDGIVRNRKGERIDPPIPKFDKANVDRVKKMKMCNVHFLRKECQYGEDCTHRHDCKPSKQDLEWLKVVARMAACRFGSGCADPKCIYGHRCQAPERADRAKFADDGGRSCIFGPDCVFPAEMHNMDTTAVKLVKV
jgi:hypothetical protein